MPNKEMERSHRSWDHATVEGARARGVRGGTMRKRYFQVVLMPEDGGEVRTFRMPLRMIRAVGSGLAILLLLAGASLVFHVKTIRDARNLQDLRAENRALQEEVLGMNATIDRIEERVDWAGEAEKEARLLAGLEPIDDETRKLGIGGSLLDPEPDAAIPAGATRTELADQTRRLEALRRQVSFQRRSYEEALESLQTRGETLAATPTICPVYSGYTVTSRYGLRRDPFTGRRAQHNGLDFQAVPGTPVHAPADGEIGFVGYNGDFGLCVEVAHRDGIETVYAHLKSAAVKPGQKVTRGQKLGAIGSSGRSTGPHLHYEVRVDGRAVDPAQYILTPSVIVD
ncbi:MAG: peptidoglycan DD-metalloendopeptidase family protein [Candidatus Eisenbacteria bacterium]|nr:peptidoglycan DD-metalloendopeptidase family protein [Candidatus Latescibacterota bacterium]MBD3301725.1 peptidoglycan DD-metalloendopeptidase family protein [Candidatus Eisenbacteria bacterium]